MPIFNIILVALGTLLGSVLSIKAGGMIARRHGMYCARKLGRKRKDIPRKVPLIGGFGLTGGALLGLFFAQPVQDGDILLTAPQITLQFRALMGAVLVVWLGGLAADRRKRAATGLLLLSHAIAIGLLMAAGVRIRGMSIWGWELPVFLSIFLTALWLFLMMQFSRFLDGIDGLLPLVALALAVGQLRIVWGHPEPYATALGVVCVVAFAVLLAVHWYPARVYLGNSGSAIPGLLLAMLSIAARTKSFLTASAILPMLIILPTLGFLGLRLLERSVLAMRLPRWNGPERRAAPRDAGRG